MKRKATTAAYRATHREELAAYQVAYRAANPERTRAYCVVRRAANPEKAKAYRATHRAEMKAYGTAYRAAHRAEAQAYHLERKYGMTLTEHAAMLAAQKGSCLLCPGVATTVDHCHDCENVDRLGSVRGLLCDSCNRFLRGDDLDHLYARIAYLEAHAAVCPARADRMKTA